MVSSLDLRREQTCAQASHLLDGNPRLPVLLFAPGMGHAPSLGLFNTCLLGPGFLIRGPRKYSRRTTNLGLMDACLVSVHLWVCYRYNVLVSDASVFSTSEFGPRKGLLIKKAQLEKTGELILHCTLRESGIQVSFIVKGREKGQGKGWV